VKLIQDLKEQTFQNGNIHEAQKQQQENGSNNHFPDFYNILYPRKINKQTLTKWKLLLADFLQNKNNSFSSAIRNPALK
jgi:hypothetical protein